MRVTRRCAARRAPWTFNITNPRTTPYRGARYRCAAAALGISTLKSESTMTRRAHVGSRILRRAALCQTSGAGAALLE